MNPSRRGLWAALAAALLAAWALHLPGGPLERFWLDWQLRWAAPQQPPEGVLVYDIDDASLARLAPRLGTWPFRRDVYALLIDSLRRAGAEVIALDLLFLDPDSGDSLLAQELDASGAPVLLAAAGVGQPELPDSSRASVRWNQLLLPLAGQSVRPRLGVVSSPLDRDGRLRTLWLYHESGQGHWPSLPLALLEAGPQKRPLPAVGAVIAFPRSPAAEVRTLPFADLALAALEGQEDAPALRAAKGQVVLIASSALLADRVMTPAGQLRGGSVLAQAYASLRDGRWLQPLPGAPLILLGALLPWLWVLLLGRTQPRLATALALGGALLLVALTALAGRQLHWFDPSPALGALTAGLVAHLMLHQHRTQAAARQAAHERAVAAEANAAKSRFLAHVSHEIRTPLHALLGLSELLEQAPLDAAQRRNLDLMQASGRHLATLINELLDLSAIELGQMQLHPAPCRLRELLQECVDLMQPLAEAKQLRCTLIAPGELPEWVLLDRQRLAQVLLNLLGNAIKFTQQGLVDLHARCDTEGRLGLAVADTGIGIAPSQQARVFEPFVQGEDRIGGTGLGLAISRELVRLMGGEISVHSVPGAGSRFAFNIPLQRAEAPDPAHAPAQAGADRPLRVLLAEDNEVNAELFRAQLAVLGAQIDHADNGLLALAMAERADYDLIVLDIDMPGLDGHACAQAIRKQEQERGRPRTPMLSLSAHAQAEDARASLAAGCDEHLDKPITRARLLQAVVRWTGHGLPASPPAQPAPALPRADVQQRQRAHARVFLSRWTAAWRESAARLAARQALLDDLVACARGLEDAELLRAAEALAQQPEDAARLQAADQAVAGAQWRLREARRN
ncbi:CHASE2 domain-containing protein [Inhella proteolytica]|uniref:Virulence sensor protein BvgS n=1 Tax=Inhella proteolytica TaxID=2795029 RepID=A0A931NHM0_9BURK|nr:CHASE2 domain-containing protein [Inhella proteolytica]MBH9577908.1 CHASE2 domain-containing protein [Inhella proteolytica]